MRHPAASAKSGRSFLSMTFKPPKVSFWKSLKSWRKRDDDMLSVISSSASSSASSFGSYSKLKRLLLPSSITASTTEAKAPSSSEEEEEAVGDEGPSEVVMPTRRAKSDKGILLRDAEAIAQRRRERRQRQPSERVTFIEPSPVPRFRNAPPLPPASPPYLDILMQENDSRRSSIIQHDVDVPTVFTTPFDSSQEKKKKRHLCFRSPLQRGQTLTFSLQNVTPEEHIIVFKFLTSNAKLQRRRHSSSASLPQQTTKWPAAFGSESHSSLMERYFVRPSAGRMIETDQTDIMLFLNQVPDELAPNEVLKDKILVRWAVIQRNTQVDAWIQAQSDSTRRKWLEMLVEQWPDQVIVRETRLKIRFV
ncbi:hypothetical protein BJV82DRAFT_586392 [Fennellomyces sp. T-0311]|nr:hypothetical protein BJV82DRAFT_586392 [Fennellomyces sp. T-0311]